MPTPDLRKHPRLRLAPMYTSVTVRRADRMRLQALEGHAYDVSASGVRIEIDETLDLAEDVALDLTLPGEAEPISAQGRVVWIMDAEDDPAARRLAIHFTRFGKPSDRARLLRRLGEDRGRRAA